MQKRDEDQIVWGRYEVAEALEAGHPVQRVYFSREASGEQIDRIKNLAQKRGAFSFELKCDNLGCKI